MNNEHFPIKEELYELYIVQNKTAKEIAEIYNLKESSIVHKTTVYRFIKSKEARIERNTKYKNVDSHQVYDLYINQNLASSEIARMLGISETHMRRLIDRFGFKKTPEQFTEMQKRISAETYAKRTEEQRLHKVEACKNVWINKTLEEKKIIMHGLNRVNKNRTPEHQAKLVASFKKHRANETPEEKAIRIEKARQGTLRVMQNMSEERKREIAEKREMTQRKRGTFTSSIPEFIVGLFLNIKYSLVIKQYKDKEKYPFKCDFYIPEIDTWIEYQGNPGHGKEPYDSNNIAHRDQVNLWKKRAMEKFNETGKKSKYSQFIYIWTELDVKKRNAAKQNNLNYLEFFNLKQFFDWYKKQTGTPLLEYKSSIN